MKTILSFLFLGVFYGGFLYAQIENRQDYIKAEEEDVLKLIDSASTRNDLRQYPESKSLLEKARAQIDSLSSNFLLHRYYQISGDFYFQKLQVNDAIDNYEKALAYIRKVDDTKRMGNAYSGLANCYTFNKQYQKAIHYHEKTLELLKDGDSRIYHQALSNSALAYIDAQQLDKALEAFFEVKEYFKSINDIDGMSLTEMNIGELYRDKFNQPELAKKHFRWAININNKSKDIYRQSQVYHNLSLIFIEEDKLDSAFYYLDRAIEYKKQVGDIGGLALNMNTYGRANLKQKNYDQAVEAFDETINISKQNGIVPGLYYGNFGKGLTYREMGASDQALIFFLRAKEIALQMQTLNILQEINSELYDLYKKMGRYEEALVVNEALNKINDSLSALDMNREVEELRLKYESDLSEQENQQLKAKEKVQEKLISQKNAFLYILGILLILMLIMMAILFKSYSQRSIAYQKLKEASEKLEAQYEKAKEDEERLEMTNNLKNRIFSVLGHDLRTPLLNIVGLLNSISQVEFTKKELDYILNHLKSETNNTLKTLQNILQWAQLQIDENSIKITKFDEDAELREIINTYKSNAKSKNVTIAYTNTNNRSFYADINQFKSIVVNLLTNAIKYSPSHSDIQIKFYNQDRDFILQIEDQGQGIPDVIVRELETKKQVNSNYGTAGEKGTGIGLTIVKDFVASHNGTLEFLDNSPSGTIVRITFPDHSKS